MQKDAIITELRRYLLEGPLKSFEILAEFLI